MAVRGGKSSGEGESKPGPEDAPHDGSRPSAAQRRYLERGLSQPGGKLPLFDTNGQRIDPRTIRSCIERGWSAPWTTNPIRPDWLVCRLTDAGRAILNKK